MKMKMVLLSVFATIFSGSAFASSKVCFGAKGNDDTKGVVITAKITRSRVVIKTVRPGYNGLDYAGSWPTYGTKVNARDGNTYLEYKGPSSDYQEVIMIDEKLLKKETTGLIQIRARGEGFFNSVFFCKDDNK